MTAILFGLLCLVFVILTVGSVSALFLYCLQEASAFFLAHDSVVLLLPVLGLVTGFAYYLFGKKIPSTQKILHRVEESQALIPFLTALFIFVFTVLSQVFGASTGRESTAVQFGAALAEFWWDLFEKKLQGLRFSRQAFIRCGLAAGFGAVFGVPWAGTLFALEVTPSQRWPIRFLPLCWISSFGAHWTALALGAHHKVYPSFVALNWSFVLILKWLCLGVAMGLMAKIFVIAIQGLERLLRRIPFSWLRPAIGGLVVALLTVAFKETRYNGLGTNLINEAMTNGIRNFDFAWKSLFTILSSGSGLKGGEVTPLMAIGSSLGFALASWLSLPTLYAASLGLVGVFASSAHIPWTGALMAWELFGFEAFLPSFVVCWSARRVLGLQGLFAVND